MNKKQIKNFINNINYQNIYDVIPFACNYKNSLTINDKEKIVKRFSKVSNMYILEDILNDVDWLTKENIDFIIDNLIKEGILDSKIYSYLIDHCPKLSNDNIKSLISTYIRTFDFTGLHLYEFYKGTRNLSKENICFLVDEVSNIKDVSVIYNFYDLATDLSKENKMKLIKAIIKINNESYMYQVATMVSNYNDKDYINLLVQGMLKSNDLFYIYEFLILDNLSLENTDNLINKLVSLKDAKYIYKTAMNCKKLSPSNIDLLVKGIINSNDSLYIYIYI